MIFMDINCMPNDLKNDERITNARDQLENTFFTLIEDAVNYAISENEGLDADGLNPVFKVLCANVCRDAFNKAYVRYVSTASVAKES